MVSRQVPGAWRCGAPKYATRHAFHVQRNQTSFGPEGLSDGARPKPCTYQHCLWWAFSEESAHPREADLPHFGLPPSLTEVGHELCVGSRAVAPAYRVAEGIHSAEAGWGPALDTRAEAREPRSQTTKTREVTQPHLALLRPVEQPAPRCDHSGWAIASAARGGLATGAGGQGRSLGNRRGRRRFSNKLERSVSTDVRGRSVGRQLCRLDQPKRVASANDGHPPVSIAVAERWRSPKRTLCAAVSLRFTEARCSLTVAGSVLHRSEAVTDCQLACFDKSSTS